MRTHVGPGYYQPIKQPDLTFRQHIIIALCSNSNYLLCDETGSIKKLIEAADRIVAISEDEK